MCYLQGFKPSQDHSMKVGHGEQKDVTIFR